MRSWLRPSLVLPLVLLGCGDDDEFSYRGTPGIPVMATIDGLVPFVAVRVGGGDARSFVADTGAPLTILDATSFPDLDDGEHDLDLEVFGLEFPGYPVASWDVFGEGELGGGHTPDGIIGGDLLRHFAFSLDYRGGRAWLSDPFDPARLPPDLPTEPALDLPMDVQGGGTSLIPGDCAFGICGTVDLPATRVLVKATFEDLAEPAWVIIDSGASAVVLSEGLFAELGDDGRPRLDGVTVGTVDGDAPAFFTRTWRLRLDGLGDGAPSVTVEDLPVLVLPGWDFTESVGLEVGRNVRALVGGSFLRYFFTTFDYQQDRLRLARYTDLTHVSPTEYIGVGFTMTSAGGEWRIADVYAATDAEAEGLERDDVVAEIDGMPIAGMPEEMVGDLFGAHALGDEVAVGVRRGDTVEPHMVLVEDLLPSYPPPT